MTKNKGKEIKRVSINNFESAINKNNIISVHLEGTEDVEFEIIKTISLADMVSMVAEVVTSCVDVEEGEYTPESYDFALRAAVLTRYANFGLPTDIDKQYTLLYCTSAYEQVLRHINMSQFSSILIAIDKKIQYQLDIMSSAAIGKLNEVIGKFGDFADKSVQSLSGITAEELENLVQNLSSAKNLSDDNIVDVILKKYDKEG